jgi:putative ABC transport system permease protein
MLRSYLTVALRHIMRDRAYTWINVVGLATGLACSIVILLYLHHEYSYGRRHTRSDRIHKVFRFDRQQNGELTYDYSASGLVAPTMSAEYPEVEDATRFMRRNVYINPEGKDALISRFIIADDRFFEILDFPAIQGNPGTDLLAPGTVYVTQTFAKKLFGDESPIGKTVFARSKLLDETYVIAGILEDPSSASLLELSPDVVTITRPKSPTMERIWEQWNGWDLTHTYVVLREDVTPAAFREKFPDFVLRHFGENRARHIGFETMPLTDLYFHGHKRYGLPGLYGDLSTCYTLGWIGLFVVFIASINFTNLATARASSRMREVGMRKVSGARRSQIAFQFLGESLLLTGVSTLLALGLVILVLPTLNATQDTQLALSAGILPALLILGLAVGTAAGSYPAFLLSSFPPAAILRRRQTGQGGNGAFRKGLVVIQFTVSVSLIVSTLVVTRQTDYMKSRDPGYSQESLVITRKVISRNAQAMKSRLQQVPGVRGVTITHVNIAERQSYGADLIEIRAESGATNVVVSYLLTDVDFLDVYQIPLLEGRGFRSGEVISSEDSLPRQVNHLMLNKEAARQLGVRAGERVTYWGKSLEVVGVVDDFHFLSLREPIGAFALLPGIYVLQAYLTCDLDTPDTKETLEQIDAVWRTLEPSRPDEFDFMDRDRALQYAREQRLSRLFTLSSGLALGIAALGLLGLVAYAVETRASEVAVRKVLGASEVTVMGLLGRELLVLVALSSVLASPLSYLAMTEWLQNFAYRASVRPLDFILAAGTCLGVTLLTIAWQTVKAARANPVDALAHH